LIAPVSRIALMTGRRLAANSSAVAVCILRPHEPALAMPLAFRQCRLRPFRDQAALFLGQCRIEMQHEGIGIPAPISATMKRAGDYLALTKPRVMSLVERLACHRGQSECIANNPASDVTTDPRNCTIRRRLKSSRTEPDSDSHPPVECYRSRAGRQAHLFQLGC
jgi:hypothetical protein